MKKWLFVISILMLALSCVGQKDDPEEEPVVDPEPVGPVTGPEGPQEEGNHFRRSLILDFTGTWCVNCPKMEAAILDAQTRRPDRLVCVSVHCLAADKMAVLPLSKDLAARFGVTAYPSAVMDMDAESLVTTSSADLLLAQCDRLLAERPLAAGIKVSSTLADGTATVRIEAKAVRDGSYSLHCVLLEDGIVASQIGGSTEHVHNNVLRVWVDSEAFEREAGDTVEWSCEAEAAEGWRVVAFVCRGGIVDNVCSCKLGDKTDFNYEIVYEKEELQNTGTQG